MTELNTKATEYIASRPPPQKEICRTLRGLILGNFPQIKSAFKWGYPAYYYKGKRICILGGFKQHAKSEVSTSS